jgi:hypothetical protein
LGEELSILEVAVVVIEAVSREGAIVAIIELELTTVVTVEEGLGVSSTHLVVVALKAN